MRITLNVDASFCPQTGLAAYGYCIDLHGRTLSGSRPIQGRCATSGEAELKAVANGLLCCLELGKDAVKRGTVINVQTDCQIAIDALTGRRGLAGGEFQAAKMVMMVVDLHALKLQYKWVKGHTGIDSPNSLCDKLARKHMRSMRDKVV